MSEGEDIVEEEVDSESSEEDENYKEWKRLRHISSDEKDAECFRVFLEYTHELDMRTIEYLVRKIEARTLDVHATDIPEPHYRKVPGMFRLLKLSNE